MLNCYIHVPFCASKCGYCAFYSETSAPEGLIDVYLDKLEQSMVQETLSTLYVGGGTPTLLNEKQLCRFIRILEDKFTFIPEAERSIEANPETLTGEKITVLRQFFTRISLGVQSFNGSLRKKIGRQCSDEALKNSLQMVKDAGFPHWNCDLIYSLPDESIDEWEQDLHYAGSCGADHISCYSLTPERSSRLGSTFEVDDERELMMYDRAGEILESYGIRRYEISNYACNGAECRHNQNVWRGGLLRGYGPTAADFDGCDRHIEVESLDLWLAGEQPETDHISPAARLNEIFAINLRTVDGWCKTDWEAVPNADTWCRRVKIAKKTAEKFPDCLQITDNRIKLSAKGLLYWNDIAENIL